MSFLPAAPKPSESPVEIAPPPAVDSRVYSHDVPAFLIANPQLPSKKTSGDATMLQADQRMRQGRRLYNAADIKGARREFDAAIDLMLRASDENPSDRLEYERRLDEMVDTIHKLDLSGMGASAAVEEGRFEKAPLEDILEMTFPVDPRLKDKVREQIASTVSQLPLSMNDTVLGYINYFSNRGHGTIVAATARSGKYRPMIQRILDEEGVPQELIHLAQAESGFIPRAMSRKAAGGMWQFLKWRGNEYGLTQTAYTDERMDPEKATRAAARHLHDLYKEFGDWYLAIAAYNCGPVNVEKAVERSGYADFWELRRRGVLPAETTNYVPIILAMTLMEKNPKEYGLEDIRMEAPLEYDTVEVTSLTSMALVADIVNISPAELAGMNPAVLRSLAPAGFSLHVPKGTGSQLMAALQMVPEDSRKAWRMHRVGAGDTLATVGKQYGVSAANIASVNRLEDGLMAEGDLLMIPTAMRPEPQAKRVSTAKAGAKKGSPVRQASAKKPVRTKKPVTVSKATVKSKAPAAMLARSSR